MKRGMGKKRWIALIVWSWMALGSALHAMAPPAPLPAPVLGESNRLIFEYLRDPNGSLEINDVAVRDDLDWQKGTTAYSNNGQGVLWLRLPPVSGAEILDLGAIPDRAILYEAAPGAFGWRIQRTGDRLPISARSMSGSRPAFRLSSPVNADDVRFIRIEQPNWLAFSATVWREEDFLANAARAQALRILILGFVLAIVAYNLAVSVFARDRLFALNGFTIASFIMLDLYLTGAGAAWLWPNQPWISNVVLCLSVALIVMIGSRFTRAMLKAESQGDFAGKAIGWFGWVALGLGLASLVVPYWITLLPLVVGALVFLAFVTIVTVRRAWQGRREALLLLVPLGLSVVPGVCLMLLNIWTEVEIGWLSPHLLEITLMLEALCFSLVLATRMRLHRSEAMEARSALIELRAKSAERFTGLQDKERARIAADLHDSLGNSLALANSQIEMAIRETGIPEDVEDRLAHGLAALRGAIGETRRISHALHPTTLIHLGWHAAVRTLVFESAAAHQIGTELDLQCREDRFGDAGQVHLLRLIQEAISNVVRHAEASWCRVSITERGETIAVVIEDDGIGLSTPAEGESSLGLFSMRQRALRLGGELKISARDPKGTIVSFCAKPAETSK